MDFQKIAFTCLVMAFTVVSATAQSGWTRGKNDFFVKIDGSHLASKKYYNPSGNKIETNKFQQSALNFYGEYGLKNRLTLIAAMPILRRNAFESTNGVFGIGDLKLELKYRLTQNQAWPIALSIAPELPTGRKNAFAKNKINPAERINLPTGDGEFNVWTTLAASKSFGKKYVSAFSSFNFRTKYEGQKFRNLYQFGLEAGWSPIKNGWVNAKLRTQFSDGAGKYVALGFVRGDATTYTLFSGEMFYKFNKNWGASATVLSGGSFLAPLKNIYVAPYLSIGIVYEKG
jgi:hypothetical protein